VISQVKKKIVRKYSMSKLTHNRNILNFQTAVLAEPSDHNSCRPGQISYNFFLYKTQPHCVGLVRKVDLLSKSLGLKTAVLGEPNDLNAGRPGQNSWNFFLYKTHPPEQN
jgi:hypothetical protein